MKSPLIKILMLAVEPGRWGPARLLSPLSEAGFEIAVLCPSSNLINRSAHVKRHYELPYLKSWRRFAKQLSDAMTDWQPNLILACDEQVIAALHFLIRRKLSGQKVMSDKNLQVLLDSLGSPEQFDAMIFKNETRKLALKLGLSVPEGSQVNSKDEAVEIAQELGFPVYLKKSFSWAGLGTIECQTVAAVENAFIQLNPKKSILKDAIRSVLKREWYPKYTATEVQKALPGVSVMFNALAWRGQYLGGFFASREETIGNNGPSTIVKIGANIHCERSAREMVKALGITGFCAFDFMWNEKTNSAVLLECNPRPNQVNHLGPKIGVDLCATLAFAFTGKFDAKITVCESAVVPLFPQEWLRNENSALAKRRSLDIPLRDSKLLEFMLNEGARNGLSVKRLNLTSSAA